jgi:hypothetical protein
VCLLATAQEYNTAVGLRVGGAGGLSLVQRIADHGSIEAFAVAGFNSDEFTVTVLGRRHVPLLTKRLNLFVGGGVHKGWNYVDEDDESNRQNPFGIDGQVGLELTIKRVTIGVDIIPQINLTGNVNAFTLRQSVTARYILFKRRPGLVMKYPWETEERQKERLKKKRARIKAKEKEKKKRARQGKSKWKMPWEKDNASFDPADEWNEIVFSPAFDLVAKS